LGIIKAIAKSVAWNLFGVIIGLLQLAVLFILLLLRHETLYINGVLREGVVLFFCSAFIVGSVIDYYSSSHRYWKLFEAFFFFLMPLLVVVFIIILYCGAIAFGEKVNIELLTQGTVICFTITVVHSLIFRALKFYSGGSK
jgi:hypothetical protein